MVLMCICICKNVCVYLSVYVVYVVPVSACVMHVSTSLFEIVGHVWHCVFVCVCVCEKEKEREREKKRV